MKIENDFANEVKEKMTNNNNIYLPPTLNQNTPLHFGIDNIDFKNDTPDGKAEFHGTTQVVFQKCSNEIEQPFEFKRNWKNFQIYPAPYSSL